MAKLKVLNLQFINAVKEVLDKLEEGSYYTREQICAKLGLGIEWAPAISLALLDSTFDGYEAVRSRGIRRKSKRVSTPPMIGMPRPLSSSRMA